MMIRNKRPNVPTSPCQSSPSNQCTILYHMFSIVMVWQNIFAGICSSSGAAFGFDPHDSRSPLSKHLKLFLQQRTAKPCWVSSSEYPEKNVPFPFFCWTPWTKLLNCSSVLVWWKCDPCYRNWSSQLSLELSDLHWSTYPSALSTHHSAVNKRDFWEQWKSSI